MWARAPARGHYPYAARVSKLFINAITNAPRSSSFFVTMLSAVLALASASAAFIPSVAPTRGTPMHALLHRAICVANSRAFNHTLMHRAFSRRADSSLVCYAAVAVPRSAVLTMGPDYVKMRDMLQQWDTDEDGSDTECMAGLEMEFLAERLGVCGDDSCVALLPDIMELFDAVLADCDEACVTVKRMQKKLEELAA